MPQVQTQPQPQVQPQPQLQQQQRNTNRLLNPQARQAIDQMKFEIAQEFGVQLGPDTTSRANGSVGGEITKRLIQIAQQTMIH